MGITVGIDLGTTYSVVAYIDPVTKAPVIIKNKYGFKTTPSAVSFQSDGSVKIGVDAKSDEEAGVPETASFYKLEMGSKSFDVSFFGRKYTAMDLSAVFLRELIHQCEETSGKKISKAVITVPAYFEDLERNRTIEAGTRAGLQVINVINEPTAAAIAYGLKDNNSLRNILIYDLGGGTFDVTVASVNDQVIEVRGSSGNHFLGGKDWDEAVCKWACGRFEDEFGENPADDKDTYNALMVKAEKAKQILSSAPYADITVKYEGNTGRYRFTEQDFRECSEDLLNTTKKTINELFDDIGITWRDIDGVILVGGSTKMKMVRDFLKQMTGREPLHGVNPDEAVAIGAAIQASIDEYCSVGSRPGNLGFLTECDTRSYNMEQLPGAKFIQDVIAHSLGMVSVSADGSRFINDIMIKKNTPLSKASTTKRRTLSVARDESLNELEIYLLQGDCPAPIDCTIARKYVFSNIAYVPGGRTQLDITYYYTLNGTIDIRAVQTETGRQLVCREEPVPEDMSWLNGAPEEYQTERRVPVTGALYMALDLSGSMSGRPVEMAKRAMINFVGKFDLDNIRIGLVAFADSVSVKCDPTSDSKEIVNAIMDMRVGEVGACNDAEPLEMIFHGLRKFDNEPFRYAIVLTDGQWMDGACSRAKQMKEKFIMCGMEIVALGFGHADKDFLKAISTRDELASVDDIKMLDSKLSKIARVISEETI